jgi:predicted Zn finger-like uncharacterized protein
MFTSCPDCARQFRIRADQLSAAGGMVICGFCGQQFNALERLSDTPQPVHATRYRSETGEPTLAPLETETADESFELEPQFDIPTSVPSLEMRPLPEPGLADFPSRRERTEEFPEMLMEEEASSQSRLVSLIWGLCALILILGIAAQLAWFNRDYLLARYPELKPWAQQLCERLDCVLLRHRNLSAIHLLNRDVRKHPLFSGTLLVNATMANRSDRVQPFPGIQLVLLDTNGHMKAYREFRPDEYLDASIGVDDGMQPEQPVHFVLEVTGSTAGAVSFEFRFL